MDWTSSSGIMDAVISVRSWPEAVIGPAGMRAALLSNYRNIENFAAERAPHRAFEFALMHASRRLLFEALLHRVMLGLLPPALPLD